MSDFSTEKTREQQVFEKLELIKVTIKEKNSELKEALENDPKVIVADKDLYDLEQQMLSLKAKKKAAVEDFKTKNFKEYEIVADLKLNASVKSEELVDLVLTANRNGKEVEIFKELDSGRKVRVVIGFKPTFKKQKGEKKGK